PFPEVALISRISNPDELGAGTISIADAVGSMLGTLGVSTPLSPSLHQTPRWNWLGNSKTQWQSFVEADKRPLDQAERLLGFEEAKGPLASAAMIDFGRLSRLENLWIAGVLDQAPVNAEGNLSIPTTASGRRLSITPAEVKEFLACMEALGRLTSFSKSDDQGRTLSRSRYDWKAR
ncbi:MAG: hypothetical protein ACK6AT_06910, partial [Planctomycetota bacterium]